MVEADRQKVITALKAAGGGSLLRGWRVELDPDGSLDVSFLEFCRACKKLRVAVDATMLFGEDSPNELTLDELAPEEGKLVMRFREWLTEEFGSPAEMFAELEPPDGDGRMDREEFVTGITKRQFECSEELLSELFNLLDLFGVGSVAMEDIMFLDMNPKTRQGAVQKAKMRGKIEHMHLLSELYKEMKRTPVRDGHRLAPRGWHAPAMETLPEVVVEKRLNWRKKEAKQRREVVAEFMQHLESVYGNSVRGWRKGLDPGATFQLVKADLMRYCRRHNMPINASMLWSILDKDGDGCLRMEEISAKSAFSLARFWKWTADMSKTCSQSWPSIMAAAKPPSNWKSSSSLQSKVFLKAIRDLGWPDASEAGTPAALASALDLHGCGIVSKNDLEWLDRWQPPEWLSSVPDTNAWRELSTLLLRHFKKPLKAWRALDEDDSNVASWAEFEHMCERVGFRGNRGGAWRALDTDISGMITMQEWHPPSANLLNSFRDCMNKNFGSIKFAFKSMDTDCSGTMSFSELRRACRRLRWEGDVKVLFACLNMPIKAGERTLSYKDLAFLDQWAPGDDDEDEPEPIGQRSPTAAVGGQAAANAAGGAAASGGGLQRSASEPGTGRRGVADVGALAPQRGRQAPRARPRPRALGDEDAASYGQWGGGGGPRPLSSCSSASSAGGRSTCSSLPSVGGASSLGAFGFGGSSPLAMTPSLGRGRSAPAPKAPARKYGVGCLRQEALASLRSFIDGAHLEIQDMEQEHAEMKATVERLKSPSLPRMERRRQQLQADSTPDGDDAELGLLDDQELAGVAEDAVDAFPDALGVIAHD